MASTVPGPARNLVRAVTQTVDVAASGDDAASYDATAAELAAHPAAGRVLGDVLRLLLEDTHPDGLDSDDVTLVIGRCYRAAAAWLPAERVDATVLLAVLAGALGVHEPAVTHEEHELPHADDAGPVDLPSWPDYAWHAPLLVADLLPFAPGTWDSYLETIFAEYAREAREELP